ncbi:SufD family Fe-S cluster assembly protein [Leptospira sp. GIMC2001]|uniref:SufD family Fe-S cluster assembly protein n=1 Tax=Leptospira sp. GIMC2001 TaxID=1513297 RepID=UPI00234B0C33|nr:SufD family Fe-S cluster assembly protein [Leptospira sp. GIMC2001]WCL51131.1 SufD family Fe-S cluster assembly protein [Leptospira sp. GIMC2001]
MSIQAKELLQKASLPDTSSNESFRKFNFKNFPTNFDRKFKPVYDFDSLNANLPKEIRISSFYSLDGKNLDYVNSLLNEYATLENYFSLTTIAESESGVFIDVASNFQSNERLVLEHPILLEIASYFPLLIIRIGENAKIEITEKIISQDSEEEGFQFISSLTVVDIGKGSNVEFLTDESHSSSAFHFRNLVTRSWEDSSLKNIHFYLGGYRGKTIQRNELLGKGANLLGYGITASSKREFIDTETEVLHRADYTESAILHKVVVTDRSHHIFTGNLHIPSNLKKIKSSQVNHNLSLHSTARAESVPKLEIFSEDVQSSHGSTVGEIDEEQIFYLKSRGLNEEDARHILIEGFLSEILDMIGDENEIERIRILLKNKIWPSKE